MQFKLSTLMRSESQSEKGSVTVRVDGDTRQRSTSDASPRLRHPAYPPIPVETRFRAGASQTLNRGLAYSLSCLEISPEKRIREALPYPK
jgi:hypothetical protein